MLLPLLLFGIGSAQETGARYLIITPDTLYQSIQPLAQWKNRMGLKTKVVKLSQTGSTATAIKNYVYNAYLTWQIKPEYLLLVGAANYIPYYYTYSYGDQYYTNMDADIYNEILSGRLNVHNVSEAQTAVSKILKYEKTPDLTDTLWFINACLIANEDGYTYPPPPYGDDSIYWSDVRNAKSQMLANGYNTIDTLSRLLGNNSSTVISRVNQGRSIVMYRGCGTNTWYYPFSVDPNQTQNGNKLPIVLSFTCGTLSYSSSPTISERWLYTGTPTTPRGGAGYFATTTSGSNIAHLRSAVCKGFINGLFSQRKWTFGAACEAGRLNVYNMYGSGSEYCGFTTIGDPSMRIWTGVPKPLTVYYDTALTVDYDSLIVDVMSEEAPVESAMVCVLIDTLVYKYGYTGSNGHIVIDFDSLVQGEMHITVTAHNKIPYLDSIRVGPTAVGELNPAVEARRSYIEAAPNPFSRMTTIKYMIHDTISMMENPVLSIYDASGRLVKSLYHESGILDHESVVSWDGTDNFGNRLPAGVYFAGFDSDGPGAVPVILAR